MPPAAVQLYNEEVNDLLAPENTKLPIHESKENGIYVCGLREDIVTGPDQVGNEALPRFVSTLIP